MNLLQALRHHGQSVWLDGLERNSILTGQLQHSIGNGLRGLLSNFTSLELAILAGDYDRDFQSIASRPNLDSASIYEYLTIQDIQLAADLMKAVYDRTHATDGFVNLDLPPQLEINTQTTLIEARRLWQAVGWSNLMLKIPATAATIPVIEQLISEGINVNATLLCSQIVYERVAEAYLRGLEVLSSEGKEISKIASVASFSIGRLDDVIAALIISQLGATTPGRNSQSLLGNVGIAWARIVYQRYQAIYQTDRWQSLAALGAQPQRLLWDISSIGSVQYYIESLVGAGTILALPLPILEDYENYCPSPEAGLTVGLAEVKQMLGNLEQIISLETIANRLLAEELQRSQDAYQHLLITIEQKYSQRKI
jgi:transaldolase